MEFHVVIPARFASTRLPGKPLRDIAGRPMIQHVYERALASGAARVVVATDDERIAKVVEAFSGEVCMTSPDHQSGTDRLAETVEKLGLGDDAVVVNLQGDEPLINPRLLTLVANNLAVHSQASVATLAVHIVDSTDVFNPNAVKVVTDMNGYALYFSRATIPWDRDLFTDWRKPGFQPEPERHARHIGIYAYRCSFLRAYSQWDSCELERREALEQLRVLWRGHKIHVAVIDEAPAPGVDTLEDLRRVEALLKSGQCK